MTAFTIPGYANPEGRKPYNVLPSSTSGSGKYAVEATIRSLKKYLADGGKVYLEFKKGARTGTIGELIISADDLTDLYEPFSNYYAKDGIRMTKEEFVIKFDDRETTIKINPYDKTWHNGALEFRFDIPGTTWVYTTVAREKKPIPTLYDHFGVQIEVGQMVMFPHGRKGDIHTRFGHILSISEAGTIKVTPVITRKGHDKEPTNLSPTINASDLVVLDNNDVKDKVTLAKLSNA